MATPKRKTSRSRRDKRRANYKTKPRQTSVCPHCGAVKLTHAACPECGYYNGRKIIASA